MTHANFYVVSGTTSRTSSPPRPVGAPLESITSRFTEIFDDDEADTHALVNEAPATKAWPERDTLVGREAAAQAQPTGAGPAPKRGPQAADDEIRPGRLTRFFAALVRPLRRAFCGGDPIA